jgi:PAS domain S-box-containing protein
MDSLRIRLFSLGQSPRLTNNENRRIAVMNRISFPFALTVFINALLFLFAGDMEGFVTANLVTIVVLMPIIFNHYGQQHFASLFFIPAYYALLIGIAFLVGASSKIEFGFFLILMAISIFTNKIKHRYLLQISAFLGFFLVNMIYRFTTPLFVYPYPFLGSLLNGMGMGFVCFHIILFFKEETERSEKHILSSREKYSSLINGAMDIVIIINQEGYIIKWNKQAEQVFGYNYDEIKHQKWYAFLIPERHREGFMLGFETAIKIGKGKLLGRREEIKGVTKAGKELPIEISVVQFLHEGQFIFNAFLRDITEKKEAEKQLVAMNQELRQFASVASHDMKEPLRTISSFSDLLARRIPDNKETKEFLHFIKDASKRMTRLLEDLISYAKAGHDVDDVTNIDLNNILVLVKNNLYNLIEIKGATVECGRLPTIAAQQTPLIQLFQNLIGNGIKYTSEGVKPSIKIDSRELENVWEISISDNGIGMKQEYLNQIFEPFTRLHTREKFEGSGIGLAVCKKIVERFKGKVWAESELNKGTVFYLHLPKMKVVPMIEISAKVLKGYIDAG